MTLVTLKRDLAHWQERFNIPEWRIRLRWGGRREMGGNVGLCYWSAEELGAEILVARDDKEPRATLLHEVLHIVIEGHKTYQGDYDELHERGINRIVAAMLKK